MPVYLSNRVYFQIEIPTKVYNRIGPFLQEKMAFALIQDIVMGLFHNNEFVFIEIQRLCMIGQGGRVWADMFYQGSVVIFVLLSWTSKNDSQRQVKLL